TLLGVRSLGPALGGGRCLHIMSMLALGHFGLLSSVLTAHRAVTTEAPRRPNGAGGEEPVDTGRWSGLAEAVDHAGRVGKRVHHVDQLLDVKPSLDIAGVSASFCRPADASPASA